MDPTRGGTTIAIYEKFTNFSNDFYYEEHSFTMVYEAEEAPDPEFWSSTQGVTPSDL